MLTLGIWKFVFIVLVWEMIVLINSKGVGIVKIVKVQFLVMSDWFVLTS